MKLETAWRKLSPLTKRWDITIKPSGDAWGSVEIAAVRKDGNAVVARVLGREGPDNARVNLYSVRGMANAMSAMADKLEAIERAVDAIHKAEVA